MEDLVRFCEEATGFIAKAMEIAIPHVPQSSLSASWRKDHPRLVSRFFFPRTEDPHVFIRLSNANTRRRVFQAPPEVELPILQASAEAELPPPSPPSELESLKLISEREEWNLIFTASADLKQPLPDSHMEDLWRWGKRVFSRNQDAVSLLTQALSQEICRWYEIAAIAYLEAVKAILGTVVTAQSNKEVVDYLTAKFMLYALLYEMTYPELVALPCMSQHARQGVFLAKVLESVSLKSIDDPKTYSRLIMDILHDTDMRAREAVEDAKPMIKERLHSPVVVEAFLTVFRELGSGEFAFANEQEFLYYAEWYLRRTRSLSIYGFNAYGWTLPNKYIAIEAFIYMEQQQTDNAIFVVFLHELAHSLIRRRTISISDHYRTNTPSASMSLDAITPLRFARTTDPFLHTIQLIKPFDSSDDPGAGNQLEDVLFGLKVQQITHEICEFFSDQSNWSLPLATFRGKFKEVHAIRPAGCRFIALTRERDGVIQLSNSRCHHDRSRRYEDRI